MTYVAAGIATATLVGSLVSSNAASKAASGARNAARDANQLQWDIFQQQQKNQAPWLNTGSSAMGQLAYGLGLNGIGNFNYTQYIKDRMLNDPLNPQAQGNEITVNDAYKDFTDKFGGVNGPEASKYFNQSGNGFGALSKNFTMSDYQADPGYQFRLEQGAKALDRSGASRGGALSGAQLRGLTDYNSGMASQEYGNAYNRFMNNRSSNFNQFASVAGLGQTANGQLGQMGLNTGQYIGNNITGAATAVGNAGLANAGLWGNALNTGANNWMQYNAMNNAQSGLQSPYNYTQPGNPSTWASNVPNNSGSLPSWPVGG